MPGTELHPGPAALSWKQEFGALTPGPESGAGDVDAADLQGLLPCVAQVKIGILTPVHSHAAEVIVIIPAGLSFDAGGAHPQLHRGGQGKNGKLQGHCEDYT